MMSVRSEALPPALMVVELVSKSPLIVRVAGFGESMVTVSR